MNLLLWCYCKLLASFTLTLAWAYCSSLLTVLWALWNETMDHRVNTFFTSLSMYKLLKFLSMIPLRNLSKGWYLTTSGIPFILWFLSLLFSLKFENLALFISDLIRLSFPEPQFHFFSMIFKILLCTTYNLLIRRVWL